jgi:hypothetical protein
MGDEFVKVAARRRQLPAQKVPGEKLPEGEEAARTELRTKDIELGPKRAPLEDVSRGEVNVDAGPVVLGERREELLHGDELVDAHALVLVDELANVEEQEHVEEPAHVVALHLLSAFSCSGSRPRMHHPPGGSKAAPRAPWPSSPERGARRLRGPQGAAARLLRGPGG